MPVLKEIKEKNHEMADENVVSSQMDVDPQGSENALPMGKPISKVISYSNPDAPKEKAEKTSTAVNNKMRTAVKPVSTSAPKLRGIKPKANDDVAEGYARVILTVGDVWGDGSGYQMLLDKDATIYDSFDPNTGTATAAMYSGAEYKIPANADNNASTSNVLVNGSLSIDVPAGTYDIFLTNPTPGDRVWLASANGNVGGRINDYELKSRCSYEFVVSLSGQNDQVNVEIYDPTEVTMPTNLVANPSATSAQVCWESGQNNETWKLRWRPYVDITQTNRLWDLPYSGYEEQLDGWLIVDNDGDGKNWGINTSGNANNDLCFYSYSFNSNTSYDPDNWLVTPAIGLGGTLKFKLKNANSRYKDKVAVYLYQGELDTYAGIDINDFVKISNDYSPGTSFTQYTINLSQYSGVGHILFRHYDSNDKYAIYLDDVEVTVPNAVTVPAWTYVNNATSPYTINGLTTGTTYEVQVQGTGYGETTDWTNSTIFVARDVETRDIVVKNDQFFDGISYDWTDDNDGKHTSKLTETATDPSQIIAMLREVYMNKTIPGNKKRGFWYDGTNDKFNDVDYAAVGSVSGGNPNGSGTVDDPNTFMYQDSYGWDIPSEKPLIFKSMNSKNYGQTYYSYLDPTEYTPNEEGLTLLLVESVDDFNWQTIVDDYNNGESQNINSNYELLKYIIKRSIKSVKIITDAKRTGSGLDAGTLFKIDCDKMNKYFLIAKGQLRWAYNSFLAEQTNGSWFQQLFGPYPGYIYNSKAGLNGYVDELSTMMFYHMFEQFSPVNPDADSGKSDIYQDLVNMNSFGVEHDCVSVPSMGHQFMMYGDDSPSDDCQDVRDLMFFIPDYRMMKDSYRDNGFDDGSLNWQMYLNYNKAHQPKMALFVIKQHPITGEQISGQETYKLHLTWDSNLLDFLPGEDGQYTLYRVITNADGTKTYQAVGQFNPNTYEYYDNVPMQKNGQQVTYVVQGQDVGKFLSLQMSNEESYIIPGLDREEQLRIALNNDYYFSRYDAATQTNNYSNSVIANNTVGTNVKPSYLQNAVAGSDVGKFKFWRATVNEVNGEMVVDTENAVNFVTAWVSNYNSATGGTLTYRDWTDQTDFSSKYYGHGYHQNPTSSTFSIVDGEVVFNGLKLYDNFSVSVEENSHPALYVYYVTLETAVPFDLNAQGTETSTHARSNTVNVPVYKTGMTMNPISAQDVEDDVLHQMPVATKFDVDARYSSRSEILGYYIYRWADGKTAAVDRSIYESDGADSSPQGQAGNQGEYYTVAMNTDFTGRTENFGSNFAPVTASFEDNYVAKDAEQGDTYTYAPVVELFAPIQAVNLSDNSDRTDYNTYGGPQQMTAGGVVDVEVIKPAPGDYTWTAGGKTYRYYDVYLKVNVLDVPQGYKVAKVRAWRKIDPQYLGERQGICDERLTLDANGEYKFVDKAVCQASESLGDDDTASDVKPGTFGAVALEQGDEIPMSFVVRVYFTKTQGSKAGGDQRYYIMESEITDKLTYQVPTGIVDVMNAKPIVSEKYYNAAGIESDTPFKGVNIVVTRYSDGSTSTVKVLK